MKHLIFIFVDHFEPRTEADVEAWLHGYPSFAIRFSDSTGCPPQHTWFYDGEDPNVLGALERLCRMGLGEIELHLHHGDDTADGLREKLERRKAVFADHGALITSGADPLATFGFIHGKWSLDNSRGKKHCGVNNELTVLREAGCYADFTFPAWGRMQPKRFNSIYYATDDPSKPKSYDDGVEVEVGREPSGDLMIFQGPGRRSGITASVSRIHGVAPFIDKLWGTCAIASHLPATGKRIDRWVRANIHVKGRPEWVFVKVHAHGARAEDFSSVFGNLALPLHAQLASGYNNNIAWRLHYVTAREAFNIVKAAEAGKNGDPSVYRNFAIRPYANRPKPCEHSG